MSRVGQWFLDVRFDQRDPRVVHFTEMRHVSHEQERRKAVDMTLHPSYPWRVSSMNIDGISSFRRSNSFGFIR